MALDIPLPTASPQDDPEQYVPLLLSAIEGFLLARDVWEADDYSEAYSYMQELMEFVVCMFEGECVIMPIGTTVLWHMETPPTGWLICDGSGYLKAEYPKLYALFGDKYGVSTDFFGVPDLRSKVPYGADFDIELDETFGEATHTLTTAEIPAHSHRVPKQSATVNAAVNVATPAARTDNPATPHITTDETGGGGAHNNIQPSYGVYFIVYAGLPVEV